MPTIRDITALRREGRLKEAFLEAKTLMEEEPGEWSNMAMFWVLRDVAVNCISKSNSEGMSQARVCLKDMEELLPNMIDDSGAGAAAIIKIRKALVPHYEDMKRYAEVSKTNPNEAYESVIVFAGRKGENIDEVLHEDFGWILYRYFKSSLNELTSIEVRGLLRDYILLKNERPSMLHSMILNFAVNFTKGHPDFIFPSFIKLWGLKNFRKEDLHDGMKDGESIPSLISRVCAQLAMTDNPLIEEMVESTPLTESMVIDMHRKQWFWHLFDLQKKNNLSDFWSEMRKYTQRYGAYASSSWHSEIIKLSIRKADSLNALQFFETALPLCEQGFRTEDWQAEQSKDGNTYPPVAVLFAKKCFELMKVQPSFRTQDWMQAVRGIYRQIDEHPSVGDEWTARQNAILSGWVGDKQDALTRYKELLKELGDKFYIWQETASCIDDSYLRLGLLLRALELEKTEDLIGPLRLQTAETMLSCGYPTDAKTYLDAYAANRQAQGKPCDEKWQQLMILTEQKESANEVRIDKKKAINSAMDFAYSDFPWKDFVLVDRFVVNEKPRVSFSNGTRHFVVSPKRFAITKNTELGTVAKVRCMENQTDIVPLMLEITDAPKWSGLPSEYGYVTFVNEAKSAVSIVTPSSTETYFFDKQRRFKIGDFVVYQYYQKTRKDEKTTEVVNPLKCAKEDAIAFFKQRIVAVDDVNLQKSLFHIVMGEGLVSDIVRFKDTELRPSVGDFLKLTYCIRKNKDGKKRIVIIDLTATDEINTKLVKEVEGEVSLKYKTDCEDASFGFVNNIYIPREIIHDEGLDDGDYVRAKAVIGGDGKWKIYKVAITERKTSNPLSEFSWDDYQP